jgi:nuclear GTP-binding protein
MKRIYLIDCPGVVPPSQSDTAEDILLRGVVRVENVEHPAQYIDAVLKRTQTKHIERTYDVKEADYAGDPVEFLSILARKGGRLLKGGEPDVDSVAKMVLNDFLRGKIPWFTPPPKKEKAGDEKEVVEGRKGQLGEMPGIKKTIPEAEAVKVSEDDVAEGSGPSDSESESDGEGDEVNDASDVNEEDEQSSDDNDSEDGVRLDTTE